MPYIPIPPPIRRPDSEELREMSIQNAKLALDQSKTYRSDSPLTEEKKEYLKELGEWLDGMGDDTIFEKDGIVREKEFFVDLIRKVTIIGSYTVVDKSWLTMITKAHSKWKRNR
jgi:hypothetical protein